MYPEKHTILVGSRGSRLALRQTEIFIQLLQKHLPNAGLLPKVIRTRGDQGEIGEAGAFTDLLEKALVENEIDVAVHSLKDLPLRLSPGCRIGAILRRDPANDCLISTHSIDLKQEKWVVGTSSPRRREVLLAMNPGLEIRAIQGNIDTRLSKFPSLGMDCIVLAKAGLTRLEWEARISREFTIEEMVPAPGQGAIAIEVRENDVILNKHLDEIHHAPTEMAVSIERKLLGKLGGDCGMPLGAHAHIRNKQVQLWSFLGRNNDGVANARFDQFTLDKMNEVLDMTADGLMKNWRG